MTFTVALGWGPEICVPGRTALEQVSCEGWNHCRIECTPDHQESTWNAQYLRWLFDDRENPRCHPCRSHSPRRMFSKGISVGQSNGEDNDFLRTSSSVVSFIAASSSGDQQGCSWTRRVIVSNRWRIVDMKRIICVSRSLWGGNACSDKVNNWHL